jgi:hypothetical protein
MKLFLACFAVGIGLLGCPVLQTPALAQSAPTNQFPSWLGSAPARTFPDRTPYSNVRFDKLEWNGLAGPDSNSARWDMEAYIGGDYDKLFFKSEGFYDGRIRKSAGSIAILALDQRLLQFPGWRASGHVGQIVANLCRDRRRGSSTGLHPN